MGGRDGWEKCRACIYTSSVWGGEVDQGHIYENKGDDEEEAKKM